MFDALTLCARLDQVLVDTRLLDGGDAIDLEGLLVEAVSLGDEHLADFQAFLLLDLGNCVPEFGVRVIFQLIEH